MKVYFKSLGHSPLQIIFFSSCLFWICSIAIFYISPYESVYGSHESFYLVLFFLGLVWLASSVLYKLKRPPKEKISFLTLSGQQHSIFIFLIWLGALFFLYDKVSIRGYDYFHNCLIDIRQQWLSDGVGRDGVSSWQNVVGYILGFLSFPYAAIVVLSDFSLMKKIGLLVSSVLPLLLLALLIESRSILLLYVVFVLASVLLVDVPRGKYRNVLALGLLSGSLFICYSMITFQNRIDCKVNIFTGANAETAVPVLLLSEYENHIMVKRKASSSPSKMAALDIFYIYAITGLSNFEYLIHQKETGAKVGFEPILNSWFSKFGWIPTHNYGMKRYGRGGATAPGVIYHDYGFIGLFLASLILGFLMWVIPFFMNSSHLIFSYLGHLLAIIWGIFFLFSPVGLAFSVMGFPPMILSFALTFFIGSLSYVLQVWRSKSTVEN